MFRWPHLSHGIAFEWRRLRRRGLRSLFVKVVLRAASAGIWFVLLPLTLALHLAGWRRLMVFTDRIGHLALEPDCLLKDQALGRVPRRRWFLLAIPGRVSNAHLLSYWATFFPVYRGRVLCFVLASMSRWGLLRHDLSRYILSVRHAQEAYRVHAQWPPRPPLLALSEADRRWGAERLRALGVPEGAWFVCVHVREPGFSPVDEELHAHRNGDIEATLPALREIVRRGGWVIRIGDPTMKPLPPMSHVIDYAHHPAKSDRLDVVLCATARFILGNTSGIALVGTVFGVPCAIANVIPIPTLWFGARDIGIPKRLWSDARRRYLRLDEILGSEIAGYRYAALYRDAGLRVDENSADDIEALACEMLDRLDGTFQETEADRTRAREVRALFRPHHYAFASCAGYGTTFLRRHATTLGLTSDTPDSQFIASPRQ
ncbi:MAG: TIGR04372 family glycosyltransferase [Burkholderiales bacterium]